MMNSNNTTFTEEEIKAFLAAYVNTKLQQMQEEKAERLKDVEPNWVTRREVFDAFDKDIKSVLNKMFHEKRIKVHKTKDAPIHDYIEYIGDRVDE